MMRPHDMRNPLRHAVSTLAPAVAGVLALVGMSACEEDVVAVVGTNYPYSMYGVLSPQLDSQWVRVFPVEGSLVPARPEPIDARVTSTDRTTGKEYVWDDSVIVDTARQFAHVYHAPFRAEFGHTYEVAVRRSDGAASRVEVTVPEEVDVVLQDPQVHAGRVLQPVLVRGEAPALIGIEVGYAVAYRPNDRIEIISNRFLIPYVLRHGRVEDGWLLPIDMRQDYFDILSRLTLGVDTGVDRQVGVVLLGMSLHMIVANEEWEPPFGVFDEDLIVQPGVLRNVVNGFGFVGAGFRIDREWAPPREAVEAAGFRFPEEDGLR